MRKYFYIFLFLALLVLLNTYIVWPLFLGEFDRNNGSIGVAHIINAQFFKRFGWYSWDPFWYAGFPGYLTYPILAPAIYTLVSVLAGISLPQAYRILSALAYVALPIGVFFLTRYLTKSSLAGVFASLVFAFAPSFNYFLIPTIHGFGVATHFVPWQLSVLLDYGEGPHLMSLVLIPFAVWLFSSLLIIPTTKKLIALAVLTSLIILINLFSAYSLIFFYLVVFFFEASQGEIGRKIKICLILGLLIFGMISFGYDLSMIKSLAATGYIHPENKFHLPQITKLALSLLFIVPGLFGIFELIKKKDFLRKYFYLGGWVLIFFVIPFIYYKWHYWLGSQPNRYMPELNLVCSIIVGWLLAAIIFKISGFTSFAIGRILKMALTVVFIFGIFYVSKDFLGSSWQIVAANKDITASSEYKIAKWLGQNLDKSRGERVYLSGSPAFFANAFANVLQLRGDADNGQANPWWADMTYQVNKGQDSELALELLKLYGAKYLVVEGPFAATPFRDFNNTERFKDLKKVSEIDGFFIYEMGDNPAMFSVVDEARQLKFAFIRNVLDKKNIQAFNSATLSEQNLKFEYNWWQTPQKARIWVDNGEISQAILFRSNFDSGWQAKISGKKIEIRRVGPNFMLILPKKSGSYEVLLSWHPPLSVYLGWLITLATLIYCGYLFKNGKEIV